MHTVETPERAAVAAAANEEIAMTNQMRPHLRLTRSGRFWALYLAVCLVAAMAALALIVGGGQ